MGLKLRIQELLEHGPQCFGYDEQIQQNIVTIRIKQEIDATTSIRKIPRPHFPPLPPVLSTPSTATTLSMAVPTASSSVVNIKPLDFSNLSKIDLPRFPLEFVGPLSAPQQAGSESIAPFQSNSDDSMTDQSSGHNVNVNDLMFSHFVH